MTRLLVLLPGLALGGAERHTLDLAMGASAFGMQVQLAAEPALLAQLPPLPGVAIGPAPGLGWRPDAFRSSPLAQQDATAALLAETRPDLALLPLPWPSAGIGPRRALAAAGVASLAVAHLVPPGGDAEAIRALGGWAPGPGRVVAVSAPTAARLAAALGVPVGVVPNGIRPVAEDPAARAAARAEKRALLGLPTAAPLLLFAGRREPQKGADLLPAVAAALAACGATLAVAGQGPLHAALAASPARLLGQVGDIGAWLLAADALLLPSRLEGCPLIVLEAAARRCPVLASAAALEAWGPGAASIATVLAAEDAETLTLAVAERFPPAAPLVGQLEAAWQQAQSQGFAAMLMRYLGLLRSLGAKA